MHLFDFLHDRMNRIIPEDDSTPLCARDKKQPDPPTVKSRSRPGSAPPPNKKAKCTDAERELRIIDVLHKIIERWHSSEILQYMTKQYGISERQASRYIKKATKRYQALLDERARLSIQDHLIMRQHTYKEAMKSGDHRLALAALRDQARLECHYASDKALLARAGLDDELRNNLKDGESVALDALRMVYRENKAEDEEE